MRIILLIKRRCFAIVSEVYHRDMGKKTHEMAKFVVVGILSTIVNYGVFVILFKLFGVFYVTSSIAGYISGVAVGYTLNRLWTFQSTSENRATEFIRYLGVYILSLLVSIIALRFLKLNSML